MSLLPCQLDHCPVSENKKVAPEIYRMAIKAPAICALARPGQFIMLRPGRINDDPLLRRPFSIHQIESDNLVILYRVVGRGTALMAGAATGDTVDILGPLGQGFNLADKERHILVGGGMGTAPLLLLADRLKQNTELIITIGARSKNELVAIDELAETGGVPVQVATDDGSMGHHGLVTELLTPLADSPATMVYSCGPEPMMRAVARVCQDKGWDCQVSMEKEMACGIGACLGCIVPKKGLNQGYHHVCSDGPVFKAESLW